MVVLRELHFQTFINVIYNHSKMKALKKKKSFDRLIQLLVTDKTTEDKKREEP